MIIEGITVKELIRQRKIDNKLCALIEPES